MFSSLTSLWRIFFSCMCCKPRRICLKMSYAMSSYNFHLLLTYESKSPPGHNSVINIKCSSVSKVSYSLMTLGWLNLERIYTSYISFNLDFFSWIKAFFITFIAMNSSDNLCLQRFTFPNAPQPKTFPTQYIQIVVLNWSHCLFYQKKF